MWGGKIGFRQWICMIALVLTPLLWLCQGGTASAGVAASNCYPCHVFPYTYKSGVIVLNPDGTPKYDVKTMHHNVGAANGFTCTFCHASGLPNPLTCTDCHTKPHVPEHSLTTTPQPMCASCHQQNVVIEHSVNRQIDCSKCHNATFSPIINAAAAPVCTDCHTSPSKYGIPAFDSHTTRHDGHIAVSNECASCHGSADIIGTTHKGSCGSCHSSTRAPVPTVIANAVANPALAVDCVSCHGTLAQKHSINSHKTTSGTSTITETAGCASCHTTLNNSLAGIEAVHNTPKNGAGACATCHNSPRADVQALIAARQSVTCTSCHTGHVFNDIHSISETAGCISCHTKLDNSLTGIEAVHNTPTNGAGSCATCHNSPRTDVKTLIAARQPVTCASCHATHPMSVHTINQVPMCAGCHTALNGTIESIKTVHADDCATCHGSGVRAAVKAIIAAKSAEDCYSCHADHPMTVHTINSVASCKICHTALNDTVESIKTVHANDCATCHGPTVRQDVKDIIAAKSANDCYSCHADHPMTVHTINQVASCAACHTALNGTIESIKTVHANDCATCHGPNVRADVKAIIAAKSANDCYSCHADHVFKDIHSISILPTDNCAACHTALGTPTTLTGIEAAHNTPTNGAGSCATCHNSPRSDVQALIAARQPVTCGNCHNGILTLHRAGHDKTILHATETVCANCHVANAATEHDNRGVDCTTCHVDAMFAPIIQKGINGTPVPCFECHFWESLDTHNTRHHQLISVFSECASCHGNADIIGVTHKKNCATCHSNSSTRPAVLTLINTKPASPMDCATCHGTLAQKHNFSTHKITAVDGCNSCHTALNGTPASIETLHNVATNGPGSCATCHKSSRPEVKAAIAALQPVTCSACHTGHVFNDIHSITETAGCKDCHSKLDNTLTGIEAIHNTPTNGAGSCATCHNSSRTDVKAKITARLPVSCADCHAPHDSTMAHNKLQANKTCAICHTDKVTGPDADYIINAHPTNDSTWAGRCKTCHASTRPEVMNTIAKGKGTAGVTVGCADCHTGTHKVIVNPSVLHYDTIFVNTGSNCSACHINQAMDTHVDMVTAASCSGCHVSTNQNQINTLHKNDCLKCHLSARPEVLNAITTGIAGTKADCTTCHGAQGHSFSVHKITETAGCKSCHTKLDANLTGIEAIHNVATNGAGSCATCHSSTRQTVIDAIKAKLPVTCTTCHAAHAFDTDHQISITAGCADCHKTLNTTTASILTLHTDCATCHGSTDPKVIGVITGGVNISCTSCHDAHAAMHTKIIMPTDGACKDCHNANAAVEHASRGWGCVACHNSANTVVQNALAKGLAGSNVNCADCHTGNLSHGAAHDMTKVPQAACKDCHVENVVTEHVDNRGIACGVCHDSTNPAVQEAIDKGRGANGPPQPVTCTECHTTSDHTNAHNKTGTPVAKCLECHVQDVAIEHVTNRTLTCTVCHSSPDQKVKDAIANGKGATGSLQTCEACHALVDYTTPHTAAHDKALLNTGNCGDCHNANVVTEHVTIRLLACATCHASTNSTVQATIAKGRGTNGQPVYCSDCHLNAGNHSQAHDKVGLPTGATGCTACHDANVVIEHVDHRGLTCITCHASTDPNHVAAIKAGMAGTQVDCYSCHKGVDHVAAHNMTDVPSTECSSCHNKNVATEHSVNRTLACTVCHANTAYASIIAKGMNGTMVLCTDCHGASIDHKAAHDMTVVPSTGCATCHDKNVVVEHVDKRKLACSVCHASTVPAVVKAIADGQAGVSVSCLACHTMPNHHANSTEAKAGQCTFCHVVPD